MSDSSVELATTELPIPVPSWDHCTSSRLFANVGNGVHLCVDRIGPHASVLASFPGRSHPQYLIAYCSDQILEVGTPGNEATSVSCPTIELITTRLSS